MLPIIFTTLTIFIITFIVGTLVSFTFKNDNLAIIVSIGTFLFLNFFAHTIKDVKIIKEKYIIHSTAGDQIFTSGSFILGSGIIKSKEYYLTNIKKGNRIERLYIPVDKTVRIIDPKLKNIAIYYKLYCKIKYPFYIKTIRCYEYNKTKDIFYIPKNAIVKRINFQ